ncbi:glycoside hydrolase family 3 N-terminal domain-containing protein [Streptomyces sp. NPDC019937]|uniref:glycoside hydrolase family 3 protein n=1 Tax=Streptomyces sp. NPDC019937 TaxID=3154787 RepID=UPI0033D22D8C
MGASSDPELRRLAYAVLQPGFVGTTAPDWVLRAMSDGLHSVVLFGRNIVDGEQVAALTARLRAENPDLVIAIDEEAGDVTRIEALSGATRPGNLALGTVDDVDLTERVAHDVGRELHAAGISLNYAPSADVNSNALNPVIGVRSFGARTDVVSRHTAAWIRGLQSAGVAACAKHFPGHGDTAVDSHLGLPTVTAGAEEIAWTALPPFIAAMEAGVRAVMTAHLLVTAYDPELPATLSRRVLEDLLRRELGYTGLVVTDAIEMAAVADRYGLGGATVKALAAGADAVCVGGENAGQAVAAGLADAVVQAVRDGALAEERLAEAATRVRRFAAWSGERARSVAPDATRSDIGLTAARRAIRVRRRPGAPGALPVSGDVHVVEFSPEMSLAVDGHTPWGLAAPLRRMRPMTTSVRLTETDLDHAGRALERRALTPAAGRALIVVVRDAARHRWMSDAVARLLRGRPDAVVVEMGFPRGGADDAADLVTYGATRVSGIAAAEAVTGSLTASPMARPLG